MQYPLENEYLGKKNQINFRLNCILIFIRSKAYTTIQITCDLAIALKKGYFGENSPKAQWDSILTLKKFSFSRKFDSIIHR